MHYFVSYTIQYTNGSGITYTKQSLSQTNELAKVLGQIVSPRRRIAKRTLAQHLKEYEESGHVDLGTPGEWYRVRDIKIRELSEEHEKLLRKYVQLVYL